MIFFFLISQCSSAMNWQLVNNISCLCTIMDGTGFNSQYAGEAVRVGWMDFDSPVLTGCSVVMIQLMSRFTQLPAMLMNKLAERF